VLTTNEVVKERMNNNNDNDDDNGWIGILALSGRLAGRMTGWQAGILVGTRRWYWRPMLSVQLLTGRHNWQIGNDRCASNDITRAIISSQHIIYTGSKYGKQ